MTHPQDELLFLALGGSDEIGMNVNLYGCQGKWLMVDLGITFGGTEYPGIEIVLPDLEFIEERRKDLLGTYAVDTLAMLLAFPYAVFPFVATRVMGATRRTQPARSCAATLRSTALTKPPEPLLTFSLVHCTAWLTAA